MITFCKHSKGFYFSIIAAKFVALKDEAEVKEDADQASNAGSVGHCREFIRLRALSEDITKS
jgi:hypothetical protein